jgi:hypothetical protein
MTKERLNEIFIGDKDPFTWVMYEGKETLMGVLYSTILLVMEEELESKIAARIFYTYNGNKKSMDFVVNRDGIEDTIEKVFEWALENEEYLWCQELTYIKEDLARQDDF